MKAFLQLLLVIFFASVAQGQSGLFGSLNRISIGTKLTPTLQREFLLNDDGTEAQIKRRHLIPKYGVSFSRVVGNYSEISVSYFFGILNANMANRHLRISEFIEVSPTEEVEVERHYQQLKDIPLPFHHFSFDYKHYIDGSFAPVGKYIGLGLTAGMTTLKDGTTLYTGGRSDPTKNNFFASVHNVLLPEQIATQEVNYNYLQLNGILGQNYPLTKNLSLCFGLTFPLYTFQRINGVNYFPNALDMAEDFIDYQEYRFRFSDFRFLVANPARKTTRLTFDVGLSFHF